MIDVTQAPYGADKTGVLSCYTPFMNAIAQAITNGGDEIYFPPGTYKIKGSSSSIKPIYKTGCNKIKFYGEGAVIICDADIAEGTINGAGGGFTLTGDNMIINGLTFQGKVVAIGLNDYGAGRLLALNGNNNKVENCYFKDGNGGAVEITGNYNTITNNIFENCNNHPVGGGDYGAIQLYGSSKYNTISENKIFGQFYSGICAYGTGANSGLAYLDIINNYISSYTSSSAINHSMGIFLLQGANEKIKIIGNTIEKADAEGIIIESHSSYPASQCIISNNIIRNCDYAGISLLNASGGTFTDFAITGNIIENTSSSIGYDHQLWLDTVKDSVISNNKFIGYKNGSTFLGKGISFSNSCVRNQVTGNQFRTLSYGILFYSPDGALKDNHIYNCDIGIRLAYCRGASVVGNIVNSCTTGVSYGTESSPLHIVANAITECTNRYTVDSGITVAPEVLTHSGSAGSGGVYSSFVKEGTLSSGYWYNYFTNVYSGDRFIVLPANQTGSGTGVIYISLIDVTNSKIEVKSTNASDSRDFVIIKMISAG